MEDLRVMCVVYVGKDAEKLTIDVLDGRGEGLGKVVTYATGQLGTVAGVFKSYQILWGRRSRRLAGFGPMSLRNRYMSGRRG